MEEGQIVWLIRWVKLVIVVLIFPVLALAFHALLFLPAVILNPLLVHLGGPPDLWLKVLAYGAVLLACVSAAAVCKLVWASVPRLLSHLLNE
jgi:hypothetical protein